tara:strand:+ start:933 stop:1994 length:1062 start_codon:yes stop_codon:yes gene_type:complete
MVTPHNIAGKSWLRQARITVFDPSVVTPGGRGLSLGRSFDSFPEDVSRDITRLPSVGARKIQFRITNDITDKPNSALIELWNLSADNRSYIEGEITGKRVLVEAGYLAKGLGYRAGSSGYIDPSSQPSIERAIFVGDIYRATTKKKNNDLITTIESGDGIAAIRDGFISISAGPGMSYLHLLRNAAFTMGLDLDLSAADLQELGVISLNGRAFHGTAHEFIRRLCRTTGHSWSIQMGIVHLLKEHMPDLMPAIHLSRDSGLLGRPEPLKQKIRYESTRARRHRQQRSASNRRNEDVGGIRVKSLLNKEIRPGRLIRLDSTDLSGNFVAKKVTHHGDTAGPTWTTAVEIFEFGE